MPNLTAVNKSVSNAGANKPANTGNASEAQPSGLFSTLLAQQVADLPPSTNSNANAPAQIATVDDKKSVTDKKAATDKTADSNSPAAPATPTADLIALLPPPLEVRTPVTTLAPQLSKVDTGKITAHAAPANTILVDAAINNTKSVSATATASNKKENALASNNKSAALNEPDLRNDNTRVSSADLAKIKVRPLTENATQSVAVAHHQRDTGTSTLSTQDGITNVVANLQHSLNTSPAHLSTTEQQSIATTVGSNKWADEFSQKITWMTSNQNNQIAELHLNPPDLGPLNVVIKVTDNQATASFTSAHSEVRDAVSNALPALREVLANNGITLGNTTVSDQTPQGGGAAFSGQQSRQQNPAWNNAGGTRNDAVVQAIPTRITANKHDGMVDTFA